MVKRGSPRRELAWRRRAGARRVPISSVKCQHIVYTGCQDIRRGGLRGRPVAQALLPVRDAWDASGLGPRRSQQGTSLAGPNLLRAMDDGQHVDLIRFNVVDDSKRPLQDFPNLRDPEFRHLAP